MPYDSALAWGWGGAMENADMSMPSFPPNGADLTREEALTMIIASIAMEELALSHIINAEGEKLQYILGTLPGARPCAGPQDVLEVNKSVASLLDVVAQNQMLLKNKLEKVLEACPPPAPPCPPPCGPETCPPPCPPPCGPGTCPPPCPPSCGPETCPPPCPPPCGPGACPSPRPPSCGPGAGQKSALQLVQRQPGLLWSPGCRLPWELRGRQGVDICWNEHNPTQIRLDRRKRYAVRYTLSVSAMPPAKGEGTIVLRQTPCGAFTETSPLFFPMEEFAGGARTLQHAVVLYPRMGGAGEAELSLVLDTKNALCVERAAMDVVEL